LPGPIIVPGDIAYPDGSANDFAKCFDPFWGRHRSRILPSPGNHEYHSPGAAPYFQYFGAAAGPPGFGYYSAEVGPWTVISINSNLPSGEGSAQMQFLRNVLATEKTRCTLAFWHHPRFSSGPNGDNASMADVVRVLYDANVDLMVVGHDHLYERMAPFDPTGRHDAARGIRQFTVGTGGATLYQFASVKPISEARASVWGVLRLTLGAEGYDWEFIPVPGNSFRDAGSGQCH
jgi:hypothetical protein